MQETSVKQMSSAMINGFESEQTSRRKIIIIAVQEGTEQVHQIQIVKDFLMSFTKRRKDNKGNVSGSLALMMHLGCFVKIVRKRKVACLFSR